MRTLRLFFSVFGEFQAPPIDLEYELQRFQSFSVDCVDANILEKMPRKMEEKKIVLVRVDSALEPVQTETLFCVNAHVLPIVHMDPVIAVPENALF